MHHHHDHEYQPMPTLTTFVAGDHILCAVATLAAHGPDDLATLATGCEETLSPLALRALTELAEQAIGAVELFRDTLDLRSEVARRG